MYPNDFIIGEMLLGMELLETRGGLAGNLAFNRDVFTEACAERITGQLQVCTRRKLHMHPWIQSAWCGLCQLWQSQSKKRVPAMPSVGKCWRHLRSKALVCIARLLKGALALMKSAC